MTALLRFWRSLYYTPLTQAEFNARLDALLTADQRRRRA